MKGSPSLLGHGCARENRKFGSLGGWLVGWVIDTRPYIRSSIYGCVLRRVNTILVKCKALWGRANTHKHMDMPWATSTHT